ncbi:MAG: glycosyltransferase 87 family protein [Anaerolineae bacterium]
MIRQWREIYREHRDFFLLFILFATFRAFTVLFFRPGGFIRDYSDYILYLGGAGLVDRDFYPFVNCWWEYPPLFPWLAVGLYRLSLLFPPWPESPRLFFNALLGLTLLLFELGNFVLLYLLALRMHCREGAIRCAWLYTGLFVPVYILTSDFDAMPLFFILLSLYLLLRGRTWSSGASLGVGFMLKITPVIFLPVGLRVLPGLRRKAGHVAAALLTIVLLAAPFLFTNPTLFAKPFLASLKRSPWETIWAVLEGYYSYGAVAGDRLDAQVTDFAVYQTALPWPLIALIFGAFYLWLLTRRADYKEEASAVSLAGLTLILFLLFSKGYSPQFLIYVLPFIVLLLPDMRGVACSVLLSILNFAEQPIYFIMFPEENWLLIAIVILRALLFLLLGLEFAGLLFTRSSLRLARWREVALAILAALIFLGGILAALWLGQAYFVERYTNEELRPAIGFLRTQAGEDSALLLTDQSLYRRFYPFLRHDLTLYVIRSSDSGWQKRMEEVKARYSRLWLWGGEQAMEESLGQPGAVYRFGHGQELLFYSTTPPPVLADLGGKVRLVTYRIESAGLGRVHLNLYWQGLAEMDKPYTAFTHILDEQGRFLAGDDRPLNPPTTDWEPGQLVEGEYILALTPEAPPGEYTIEAGLYEPASGQRLPATGPDGKALGDRIILKKVRLSI